MPVWLLHFTRNRVDLLNAFTKDEEWDWVTRCERERGNDH